MTLGKSQCCLISLWHELGTSSLYSVSKVPPPQKKNYVEYASIWSKCDQFDSWCGHQAIPRGKSFFFFFFDDHGVRHQESSLFPQFMSDYFPAVSFADIPKGCFYFYGMSSQTSSFDLKSCVLPLPFFFSAGAASDLISHKASHLK